MGNGDDGPALEFAGLFKRFGDNVAVDHIDLTVPAGSFFGLVGPNGAGKTTALSMAVGLLRPDGGTIRIFGRDVWADPVAAKALIGVLPDGMALPDRLSGREVLLYLGLLRGMSREVVTDRGVRPGDQLPSRPGLRHLRARPGHHAAVAGLRPGAVRGQAADRRPLLRAHRRGEDLAVGLGRGGGGCSRR
jgi:energy-coupling factor transporter ATP-binding protein EcfA2